jgi:hypothetical protein
MWLVQLLKVLRNKMMEQLFFSSIKASVQKCLTNNCNGYRVYIAYSVDVDRKGRHYLSMDVTGKLKKGNQFTRKKDQYISWSFSSNGWKNTNHLKDSPGVETLVCARIKGKEDKVGYNRGFMQTTPTLSEMHGL